MDIIMTIMYRAFNPFSTTLSPSNDICGLIMLDIIANISITAMNMPKAAKINLSIPISHSMTYSTPNRLYIAFSC